MAKTLLQRLKKNPRQQYTVTHCRPATALKRLENNKVPGADGLPAELFKGGSEEHFLVAKHDFCRFQSRLRQH